MSREIGASAQAGLMAGVEQAADGIVITDAEGIIRYVNPGFTDLTGYSSADAVGQSIKILRSGRHAESLYAEMWETIRSGAVWHGEMTNRRKDGTLYLEEMQISPIRATNGEISGYVTIKHDVTSRRAEEEASSFLAAIVESSEAAIVAYTPAGNILTWNHGAESIFGYSAEEIVGTHLSVLMVPERVGTLPGFTERILRGESIPPYESVCLRKGDQRIHTSVMGSPIRDRAGDVIAVSLIVRDISERKRAEDALRDSEERFRIMADGCPSLMWVTDAEGGNQFINRAYRELLGTTHEEMEGQKWHLALHPEDAPAYIEAFQRAVREQASFHAETRVQRPDGEWRWIESHAEPRISASGEFLGHVGVSPDITERKRSEDALRYQYSLIRAIHEASPDGILVVNENNPTVSYNRKYLDIWQISLSDSLGNLPHYLMGNPREAILSAALERVKDRDSFLEKIRELSDNPEINDHREIELSDGRTLERYSTSLGRKDDADRGRVWFFRDVTERKEAAQRLQHSEEKFRQLAENIHEVFWMMDTSARTILYVSPAYEEIWGRKCDSLYRDRENWVRSIHPEDAARALSTFSRQVQGEVIENEYRILRPSGEIRWIRDRAFPIRDREGNVIRLAGVAEDTTARKESELRLLHLGLHDDLTDLPNRRLFREMLERALRESDTGRTGGVFFIDLDGFKLVNDTLGHAAGDDLLKAVAGRWLAEEGLAQNLARFGGDEFTLFVTGAHGEEPVRELGARLLSCLDQPFRIAGQDVFIGASIGISLFPEHSTDADVLMRAADSALHEAKATGKNQVKFFVPTFAGAARGRLEMATRLRKALAQSEFRLQFQPQFASQCSSPRRFEALIRWYPFNEAPVQPMEFVPLAEQNGLIVPIGTWVLQQACQRCAGWQTGSLRGVGVAVNVSGSQFACPNFIDVVVRALKSSGLPPNLLELELTESVFLRDMDASANTLRRIRDLGVTIALDDFGTGYSSLSYLQNLPLDALKIDRSFLAETEVRPQGAAVLRCLVDLAHAHGLRVVAEGVETEAQKDLLDSLGCDELQGIFLGAPSFDLAEAAVVSGADPLHPQPSLADGRYPWDAISGPEPVTACTLSS